tara:strand:+ start:821 stop:1150 length:330 start_codon:yes stop_codon:yes gene_type:complete
LLSCVPLAAAKPDVASVKIGPVPSYWELNIPLDFLPKGLSAAKHEVTSELEKSGFVIHGSIYRGGRRNLIVRHTGKRQMSLFMLKHSEIPMKVYDFYFNKKGNRRVNVC